MVRRSHHVRVRSRSLGSNRERTRTWLDDLIMFGYVPGWNPSYGKYDSDASLVNMRTGEIRRLPYPMGGTLPGCFSKDRRSVYISGVVLGEASLGLFEIDLQTG